MDKADNGKIHITQYFADEKCLHERSKAQDSGFSFTK